LIINIHDKLIKSQLITSTDDRHNREFLQYCISGTVKAKVI